jgi:hypothetical protein
LTWKLSWNVQKMSWKVHKGLYLFLLSNGFRTFSGHFMTIFRSNYFHPKLSFFYFFLNIRYIYANIFKIFKFEFKPLDNKKRYRPLCTFQEIFWTFHVNYHVKLFPPKKWFFNFCFQYSLNICCLTLSMGPIVSPIRWLH